MWINLLIRPPAYEIVPNLVPFLSGCLVNDPWQAIKSSSFGTFLSAFALWSRSIVLFEKRLSIIFYCFTRTFNMSCKERTDHDHRCPETNRFGTSPWVRNTTIRNDWLIAAFEHQNEAANCQPPVLNPVFTFVIQTLPGPIPTLVASAPAFSNSMNSFRCSNISSNDKGIWQFLLMLNHPNDTIRMTVCDINSDVPRRICL